ncbi:MAG: hypothetical protein HQ464_03470 [Planctomycetes bacterium]|nr:hypothetical protein [Planctomycetota bacterium]
MMASRSSHLRGSIVIVAAGLAFALVSVSGCQKSNGLTPVSGRVTFKGNPVPMGNVYIEPDASQGNKGPQCRSSIIKGIFASRPEFGSVSGPVIVDVEGSEQRPESEFPLPLFRRYTFKTEIPKGRATLDIVVPEDVAKPRR